MDSSERKVKKDQFIELRAVEEMSLDKCSELLNVSKPTLIKWEKDFKDQISQLKNTTLSTFIDSIELGIRSRLTRLKNLSQKLEREIQGKDLGRVNPDRIIKLYIETESKINEVIKDYSPSNQDNQELNQKFILAYTLDQLDEEDKLL